MRTALPILPLSELQIGNQDSRPDPKVACHADSPRVGRAVLVNADQWDAQQAEIRRLQLLLDAFTQIKAKGEPTIPFAEVKRRVGAKMAKPAHVTLDVQPGSQRLRS